jgi:hypothetical protein
MSAKSLYLTCVWCEPHNWDTLDVAVDVPDEAGYYVFTNYAGLLLPPPPDGRVLYVGMARRSTSPQQAPRRPH